MIWKIVQSPFVNLLAGVILVITAGAEVIENWGTFEIGAHHGVAIFGLLQILKALPEVMEGLEEIEKARRNKEPEGAERSTE